LLVIDEQMKKCLVVHTAGAKNILLVSWSKWSLRQWNYKHQAVSQIVYRFQTVKYLSYILFLIQLLKQT
jgi:hypothetical protein